MISLRVECSGLDTRPFRLVCAETVSEELQCPQTEVACLPTPCAGFLEFCRIIACRSLSLRQDGKENASLLIRGRDPNRIESESCPRISRGYIDLGMLRTTGRPAGRHRSLPLQTA